MAHDRTIKLYRALTAGNVPGPLEDGELALDALSTPPKLYTPVPTSIDPSGRINLLAGAAGVTISDTPPVAPTPSMLWWDSVSGRMFIWFDDGDSAQWVETRGLGILSGPEITLPLSPTEGGTGVTSLGAAKLALGVGAIAANGVPLPVDQGGTGATTAEDARAALGIEEIEDVPHDGATYGRKDGDWAKLPNAVEQVFFARLYSQEAVVTAWAAPYFSAPEIDTQNAWNGPARIYTPTRPGFYQFQFITPLNVAHATINKNSVGANDHTRQILAINSGGQPWFISGSVIDYMNGTTDNIQLFLYSTTAGEWTAWPTFNCYLSVYRLPSAPV